MQPNILSRLEILIGIDKINLLKSKIILVVGIGGVGGYVVESLARSGIGTIIIVDYDTIDITNINRQIIALTSTIGKKKVDVMEKRINDINSNCKVIKYDLFFNDKTKNEILDKNIDFIIDCCDSIESKKILIKEAIIRKKRIISSMGTANKMNPSLLEIVDIRKTINDPLARIIRKFVKEENIKQKVMVLSSQELPQKNGNLLGSNSFVPSSAGLLIGSYVIKELIKE